MKRRALYIIIGTTLVLLSVACGQQHQAKGVIRDFVSQNATDPSAGSAVSIVKFDSARVLSDSVIATMRTNADTISRYRKPMKYADGPTGKKLYYARVAYTLDGEEYSETFYLDEHLTRVVAFKTN